MPKNSIKYRRKTGLLFLAVYFAFLLIGTIHHHSYDLNPQNILSRLADDGGVTDLNMDFFSVCSLHQFSQTIANKSYRSSDIIQTLSCIQANVQLSDIKIPVLELYSKTSPRAPPVTLS